MKVTPLMVGCFLTLIAGIGCLLLELTATGVVFFFCTIGISIVGFIKESR